MKFIATRNDRKVEAGEYLWRYMDMHKFLNFLFSEKLHFSRMDLFEDKMEGVNFNQLSSIILWKKTGQDCKETKIKPNDNKYLTEKRIPEISIQEADLKIYQKKHYLSSWYVGEKESVGMWNLYSNKDSVCIRIERNKLENSLNVVDDISLETFELDKLYHGFVLYKDFSYKNVKTAEFKQQYVPLRKDDSFKHEVEYRFVIRVKEIEDTVLGISLPLEKFDDLNIEIICHPKMEAWKFSNIREILERSNYNFKLKKSELFV